jgi:predicted unusual protein kinase regulating ubiquinone biosynthesis (AarF/ABC1/UbiB family)
MMISRILRLIQIWIPIVLYHSPENITHYIEKSGSLFIKLTQWIIQRKEFSDHISSLLLVELKRLQHNVHCVSTTHIPKSIIIDNKSYKVECLLGSGSIGAVYLVSTFDMTEKFVYKCIHENIKTDLIDDCNLVKTVLNILRYIIPNNIVFNISIDELLQTILEQVDLRVEVQHLGIISDNFRNVSKYVKFPTVYSYSTNFYSDEL